MQDLKYTKLFEEQEVELEKELREYELTYNGDDNFTVTNGTLFKSFNVTPYDKGQYESYKGVHGALFYALHREKAYEIYKAIKGAEMIEYHFGNIFAGPYTLNEVAELTTSLTPEMQEKIKENEKEFLKEYYKDLGKEIRQKIYASLETRAELMLCVLEALFFWVRENDEDHFYDGMSKEEIIHNYNFYINKTITSLGIESPQMMDAEIRSELFSADSKFALWVLKYDGADIYVTATVEPKELRSEDNIQGLKGMNFSLETDKIKTKVFKNFECSKLSAMVKKIALVNKTYKSSKINESVENNIWYHSSDNLFDNFSLSNNKLYKEIDLPVWFFTKDLNYAKTYGKYLYKVQLNVNNTLDFSKKGIYEDFIKYLETEGLNAEEIESIEEEQFYDRIPYWTCENAFYYAIEKGYDSIFIEEELENSVISIGVFDLENIKIIK